MVTESNEVNAHIGESSRWQNRALCYGWSKYSKYRPRQLNQSDWLLHLKGLLDNWACWFDCTASWVQVQHQWQIFSCRQCWRVCFGVRVYEGTLGRGLPRTLGASCGLRVGSKFVGKTCVCWHSGKYVCLGLNYLIIKIAHLRFFQSCCSDPDTVLDYAKSRQIPIPQVLALS